MASARRGLAVHGFGRNTIQLVRRSARLFHFHLAADLLTDSWPCQRAEAIIYSPLGVGTSDIAEEAGDTLLRSTAINTKPRRFPGSPVQLDLPQLVPGLRSFVRHGKQHPWQSIQQQIDQWRRACASPATALTLQVLIVGNPSSQIPFLYGYPSPTVVPKPSDWPDWLPRYTGYWFNELCRIAACCITPVAAGPPPVYISFGSMRLSHIKVFQAELVH